MKKLLAFHFFIFACISCKAQTEEKRSHIPDAKSSDDFLALNEYVPTDSNSKLLIERWKNFLQTKNENPEFHPYWNRSDFKKHRYPFNEIYGIEFKGDSADFYRPTLLAIIPTKPPNTYILKTAFIGKDRTIRCIYNVLAQRDSTGSKEYFFQNIQDYETQNWKQYTSGSICYRVSPQHEFRLEKAAQMDRWNRDLAAFFDTTALEINYFLCKNHIETQQIRGVEYSYDFYAQGMEVGGFAYPENRTIYAGNDSELYPHEAVHLYIHQKFHGRTLHFLNEGAALLLGGGQGKSFAQVRKHLKAFLQTNPKISFLHYIPENSGIDEGFPDPDGPPNFSLNSAFAALICESACRKGGKQLLFKILRRSENEATFWEAMKLIGIQKENIGPVLMQEIRYEPLNILNLPASE
jgi:hypothetical protein